MNRFFRLCLSLAGGVAPLLGTTEPIQLKPEDLARLGIAFAPVKPAADGSGARFPATVIASPESVSTLTAPLPGVIEKWLVSPGDTVKADQPLALLRSPEALRLQQEWMTTVATLESARVERVKLEELLTAGIVSAQRVTSARRAEEQAAFAQQAAAAVLRRVGFTPERLGALRSQGEGLGFCHLVAPAAGVVTRRLGVAGDFAEANRELVRLRADAPPWVSLVVPARHVAGLSSGQKLKLSPGGEELVLRQVDQGVDERSQTVSLFAEFLAATPLLPGQIVSVSLPVPRTGLLVPGAAVVHRGDEASVFVRTSAGIESRVVTLQSLGADYMATAGLRGGEEVVVRGAAVLKGLKAGFGQIE